MRQNLDTRGSLRVIPKTGTVPRKAENTHGGLRSDKPKELEKPTEPPDEPRDEPAVTDEPMDKSNMNNKPTDERT
eukprot:10490240-Ditylum_brightwellii.AAC.1